MAARAGIGSALIAAATLVVVTTIHSVEIVALIPNISGIVQLVTAHGHWKHLTAEVVSLNAFHPLHPRHAQVVVINALVDAVGTFLPMVVVQADAFTAMKNVPNVCKYRQ